MFCFQNTGNLKMYTLNFVPFPYITNSRDLELTVSQIHRLGVCTSLRTLICVIHEV